MANAERTIMSDAYKQFETKMAEKFPRYFGEGKRYGGFSIGEGWYPIIESLVGNIDHYTKWRRNMRANDLRKLRAKSKGMEALIQFMTGKKGREPSDWDIERAEDAMENGIDVTPKVNWIHIQQIKEKFGGLRFYYDGGDAEISGMVRMAESWADRTCEECGNKGMHRNGGWIRTLCDEHEAQYQARKQND
jgi:hypothetical protein